MNLKFVLVMPLDGTNFRFGIFDERHFIYDTQGRLIAEMAAATGAPIVDYLWLIDEAWASPVLLLDYAAVIAGTATEPSLYMIEADHLGVPVALYDEAGLKMWEHKRLPFGAPDGPPTGPLAATLTTALTPQPSQAPELLPADIYPTAAGG